MTTKEEIQGTWNQVVGAVKKKYANITGDDLASVNGNIQQLAGLLQRKTGEAREDIEYFLRSCSTSASSAMNRVADVASDYAGRAGEGIKEGYEYMQHASQEGYDAAQQHVRHRPLESLAIAFGIGVVAGLITGASLFGRRN
jgi:uncharacterized protein YjbJ (UPF0337 family)